MPPEINEDTKLSDIFEVEKKAVSALADVKTEEEIEDLNNQQSQARINRYNQDTGERKKYANRVFFLVTGWIIAMFCILLLQGFCPFGWKPLPDSTLYTLVGGSTASILGILYAVVSNLFKRQ